MRFVLHRGTVESCSCRVVEADSVELATHEAVGIDPEGESGWYVAHVGDAPYDGCGQNCTCADRFARPMYLSRGFAPEVVARMKQSYGNEHGVLSWRSIGI